MTASITCFLISSFKVSKSIESKCWLETTIVSTRLISSLSYSIDTCAFPSGPRYVRVSFTSSNLAHNYDANSNDNGIKLAVSLQA